MNAGLEYKELINDIKTNLYLSILNELDVNSNPEKIKSWIISMIKFRTLDDVRKRCGLNYDSTEKQYTKRPQITVKIIKSVPRLSGDKNSGGGNLTLEYAIRNSNIKPLYKILLIFYFVFGYKTEDIAKILNYSTSSINSKIFNKAVKAFASTLDKSNLYNREDIYRILDSIE